MATGQEQCITKNIDTLILNWVVKNSLSNNFNQEIENYIYSLRQMTKNPVEIDYLDYKLNIWNCIEIRRHDSK